jgi:hypothetical protein
MLEVRWHVFRFSPNLPLQKTEGSSMHGIKAIIHSDGDESSVEFSLEEAISQYQGKAWADLNEAEQDAVLRDYALSLFQRQNGVSDTLRVELKEGTFSRMHHRDV